MLKALPLLTHTQKAYLSFVRPCFLLLLLPPDNLWVLYALWQASCSGCIGVMADYWFLLPSVRYFSISLAHLTVFFIFLLSLFIMPSILLWSGTRIFQKVFFNNLLYCAIWSHCLFLSLSFSCFVAWFFPRFFPGDKQSLIVFKNDHLASCSVVMLACKLGVAVLICYFSILWHVAFPVSLSTLQSV